jgi:hypothetical protein
MQLPGDLDDGIAFGLQLLHLRIPCISSRATRLLTNLILGTTPPIALSEQDGRTIASGRYCTTVLQLRSQPVEHPLKRLTEVAEYVPAVGNLNSLRCALGRSPSIFSRPITRDDLNARMLLKPQGNRFGGSFWQQIHDPMRVTIDKYRAVYSTTAQRKIVYPKHAWGWTQLERGTMNQPQDGRGARRHRRALTLPTSSFTAQGQTKVVQGAPQS